MATSSAATAEVAVPTPAQLVAYHNKNVLFCRVAYFALQFSISCIFLSLCDAFTWTTMFVSALFHVFMAFSRKMPLMPAPVLIHFIFTALVLITAVQQDPKEAETTIAIICFLWMTAMAGVFHVIFTYSRRNFAELITFNSIDLAVHVVFEMLMTYLYSTDIFYSDLLTIFCALKISIVLRTLSVLHRLYQEAMFKSLKDMDAAAKTVPAAAATTHVVYNEDPDSEDEDDEEDEDAATDEDEKKKKE